MAALSLKIWMTSLYCLHLTAYCRFLPTRTEDEDFEALCSRKCSPSPEDPPGRPLYQCSCSKSCTVYDDCCYDAPFRNTRKSLEHEFFCLSVAKRGEYLAVISCPRDQRSDTCRNSLGHLPPVTSRTTNVTYGNLFCAACNEDADDLITWKVHLRCLSSREGEEEVVGVYDSDGFWTLDEEEGTRRPCRYHVDEDEDLEGLEVRPCHTPPIVSACSPSWRQLELLEKCRSYKDPVYVVDRAYRNSHCAHCNYKNLSHADCVPETLRRRLRAGEVDSEYVRSCVRRSPERCLWGHGTKGVGRSISSSVDVSLTGCVPPEGKRCCEGQRYKSGVCRSTRKG